MIALLKPNWWPKGGTLTMQVFELRHLGLGDLLERLERLRRQLTEEGLFAPERKVRLPFLPVLHRTHHAARTRTPRRMCCATPSSAGRP